MECCCETTGPSRLITRIPTPRSRGRTHSALAVAINDLTSDLDGEETGDACDSYPDAPNAHQADADADGMADVCQLILLQ